MLPFKPNKEYTTIAVFAGAVCAVAITVALFVFRFADIRAAMEPIFSVLSPVALALIFAYLIRPLSNRLNLLTDRVCKRAFLSRFYAISLAYVIIFTLFFLFIFFLVPALLGDTGELGNKIVRLFGEAENFVNALLSKMHLPSDAFSGLAATLAQYYDRAVDAIISLVQSVILGTYKTIFALLLAAFILFHKESLAGAFRRFTVAVFPQSACAFFHRVLTHADKTFGKYLIGRIVEALIIGSIYLVVLPLVGIPYPYLVTVVMVITNFIPVVGAYIGGIPCGILILTENPVMVFWFIVICLGMEQIDGNIIIPRVIGSILGLRGVWIMVAVALFGGLFGIWGMFLSAPLFSIVYVIIRDFADARLSKKGRSPVTHEYEELFASTAPPRRRSLRAAWNANHPPKAPKEKSEENESTKGDDSV